MQAKAQHAQKAPYKPAYSVVSLSCMSLYTLIVDEMPGMAPYMTVAESSRRYSGSIPRSCSFGSVAQRWQRDERSACSQVLYQPQELLGHKRPHGPDGTGTLSTGAWPLRSTCVIRAYRTLACRTWVSAL